MMLAAYRVFLLIAKLVTQLALNSALHVEAVRLKAIASIDTALDLPDMCSY